MLDLHTVITIVGHTHFVFVVIFKLGEGKSNVKMCFLIIYTVSASVTGTIC